jgi:hypothetical protein
VEISNNPVTVTFSLRLELTDVQGGSNESQDFALPADAILKTVNIQMFKHSVNFYRIFIRKQPGDEIVFLQALDDDPLADFSGIARGFLLAPGIAFEAGTEDLRYVVGADNDGTAGECRAVAHFFFEEVL